MAAENHTVDGASGRGDPVPQSLEDKGQYIVGTCPPREGRSAQ